MREPFHRECFYVTGTHFLFKKTMPGPNFFEFKDYDIIDRLKTNNTFQFANFVDINKLKDKYLLSL